MKGSLVHALIVSLDDRERRRFILRLHSSKEAKPVANLFHLLEGQSQYSETALLGALGQTKRQKNLVLEQLGQQLITFLGDGKPEVHIFQILAVVPRLLENHQERQAVELIEWAISLAEETENYHAIQLLWRLAERFPDPRPIFQGMTYESALNFAANLIAYRQLEQRLRNTPTIPNAEDRLQEIAAIEASQLLESPGMALGYEARLLYWRIKSICKYLSKRHQEAIVLQQALVAALQERMHEDADIARRWLKESGSLAVLYGLVNDHRNAKAVLADIAAFETRSNTLEGEKLRQLYPGMITVGVDLGDTEFAGNACAAALQLVSDTPNLLSVGLQCDILFHSAGFYLACGRVQEAAKLLIKLRSYTKSSFRAPIFAMTKVLEIVLEIELRSFEDALRLAKNLRMSKHDQIVPGIAEGLQLLSTIALKLSEPSTDWRQLVQLPAVSRATELLQKQPILDYFNLNVWLEAKQSGVTMMEILHHLSTLHEQ